MKKIKDFLFNLKVQVHYYNVQHSIKLNRGKYKKLLPLYLPWYVVRFAAYKFGEWLYGTARVERLKKKELSTQFTHELAIVAICKNEGPYIGQWIDYHRLVGVEKFYIYDNESADDTAAVLKPYMETGVVVYKYYPGVGRQLEAYNDAVAQYKEDCRYMAFIDLDEYIMPMDSKQRLPEVIQDIVYTTKGAAGVGLNWCLYGSSGKETQDEGLLAERFLRRGENAHWGNFLIKTVANPRLVKNCVSPHFLFYKLGAFAVNENGKRLYAWFNHDVFFNKLRINHYFCKSKEEWLKKRNRGLGDRGGKYDMTMFDRYDLNDIYDESMLVYVDKLKHK